MARMFPRTMPTYIRSDPFRSAECRVFDLLEKQLPAAFTVFYSRPWLGLAPDGREIDGEADFVVAHPRLGILVAEVKGGRVARDGESGTWTSRDRLGVVHTIRDPVRQARDSKYELLRKLRESNAWQSRFIRARYSVILTDSGNPGTDLGADMPLRIFAFSEDLLALGDWVQHRMGADEEGSERERDLGQDGLAALELLLARSFQLRVPLRNSLDVEDRSIALLTEQQFHLLEFLLRNKRCAVEGGAGSGKTVLALELAQRLVDQGYRTVLTCYNRPLADSLRDRVSEHADLTVRGFHQLCFHLAREAGLDPSAAGVATLDDESVDLLVRALARRPDLRFDAIVIDEAQDFRPEWMAALELSLRDERDGLLFAFYDSNQRVYESAVRLTGLSAPPFPLTRNLRNTRQIFTAARPFYTGEGYVGSRAGGKRHRVVAGS